MDASTFQHLADKTRMSKDFRDLVYEVLVEGQRVSIVAERSGKPRQAVHRAVKRIEKEMHTSEIPSDWKVVTVILPPNEAQRIQEEERKIHEQYGVVPRSTTPA